MWIPTGILKALCGIRFARQKQLELLWLLLPPTYLPCTYIATTMPLPLYQVCAVTKVRNIIASLRTPQLTPKQALALGPTELYHYWLQIEWGVGDSKSFGSFKEVVYIEKFFVPHVHAK